MSTDPARILATLIELGFATQPSESLPPEWRAPYEAVRAVGGVRDDRLGAFSSATESIPGGNDMFFDVVQACLQLQPSGPADRLRVHSAWEAFAPPPPPEWCVDGLLTRPSLNLVVGDPGAKKSWLALDLAVCVAMGLPWLGCQTRAMPALFVDEESGLRRLGTRIHAVMHAHKAQSELPFYYLSLPGLNLRETQDTLDLTERALAVNAGLIVIDPLAQVMRGGDENSVLSVLPVFANLRRLAETCNAAVLVLHHTNKHGGFRGSTSISAGVDHMLAVESQPQDTLIYLRTLKARDQLPVSLGARAHFGSNLFWLTPTDERPASQPAIDFSPASRSVLQFLADHRQATTPQIVAALNGATPEGCARSSTTSRFPVS